MRAIARDPLHQPSIVLASIPDARGEKLEAVAQKRIIAYLKNKVATQSSSRDLGKA